AALHVVAKRDFVDHDADPVLAPSTPFDWGTHGTATLSVLAGYAPGHLIGPAYGAEFILARTENDATEPAVEEDNWIAAVEWADSLGVDVTSTSLGYLEFDPGYPSLTYKDMNGHTAKISIAATMAAARGIVVVTAAGNEGFNNLHNTLNAP